MALGASSRPSRVETWPVEALKTTTKQPPPMPVDCGCTTLSINCITAAASTALPPAYKFRVED